jgi:hypothetical protein
VSQPLSPTPDFDTWAPRAVMFADAFDAPYAAGAWTVCRDYAIAAARSARRAVGDQWGEPEEASS